MHSIRLSQLKTLLILSAFLTPSCVSSPPKWDGKIYVGNFMDASVDRFQDRERLSCGDPKFSGFMCMSKSDFKSFIETYLLGCTKWKKDEPLLTPDETGALFDIMQRVNGQR